MDGFTYDPRSPWPEDHQRRVAARGREMRRAVEDQVFDQLIGEDNLSLAPWEEALLKNVLADRPRGIRRPLSDQLEQYLQEICS